MMVTSIDIYQFNKKDLAKREYKQRVFPCTCSISEDNICEDEIERSITAFNKCRDKFEQEYDRIASIYWDIMYKNLDEIEVVNMEKPSSDTMQYFEQYMEFTRNNGKLIIPQAIVVNEKNILMAGYESFLILKKNDVKLWQCYTAQNVNELRNAVLVRFYMRKDDDIIIEQRSYQFLAYNLELPVVPGDNLLVNDNNKYVIARVELTFPVPKICLNRGQVVRHANEQDFNRFVKMN